MIYKIDESKDFYRRFIEMQKEGLPEKAITTWIDILVSQYESRIIKDTLERAKKDAGVLFDNALRQY